MVAVIDPTGQPVIGNVRVTNRERRWEFVPAAEWLAGEYSLLVDRDLEDMSGNSLEDLFDIDMTTGQGHTDGVATVELPFTVAQAR